MHLNELAVGVGGAVLVGRRRGGPRVDDRVGRAAEDDPRPAGGEHDGDRWKRLDPHRVGVERHDPAAVSGVVARQAEELPRFVLANETLDLVAAHLLVQRIEELLTRRRARERRPVKPGPAEAPKVEQALQGPVEHDAHAVEEVDDSRRRIAHRLDGSLVREEVAAVDRVVEVNLRRVAFPLGVDGAVDPALSADRMAALDGHDREEIDGDAHFGDPRRRHEACEAPADHDDALRRIRHAGSLYVRNAAIDRTPIVERSRKITSETYAMRRWADGETVIPQTIANDQRPFERWKVAERIPST